jgi:hypothetical protein
MWQTDPEFVEEIQKWGCHLLCFLTGLELKLSHEDVNQMFRKLKETRICSWESFVIYPDKLLEYLGSDRKYLGKKPVDFKLEEGDMCIQLYFWKEKNLKHFVLSSLSGDIIYDPIEGGSQTVKYGVLDSIRVVRK